MTYTERLQKVAVLGAAGKMGSGILLLTAIEVADLALLPENRDKHFVVYAIDVCSECLNGLRAYVKKQARRFAEKKIVWLREMYKDREDLIENFEIIDEYIDHVLTIIRPCTRIEAAYEVNIVFEAVIENPELKTKLLKQINENNPVKPWFFTNTSSIPIEYLDEKAGLDGRLIGFHFYNPPAVQKLVELIKSKYTKDELEQFALEYAKKLKKIVVPSNDFAGFIGNGHFMRDALFGIQEAQRIAKELNIPLYEAIYIINKISQEFLVRPMGIFQLIDYVGIDVVQYIMSVMNPYLKDEDLHSDLLDKMLQKGIKGGQYSDGSQKDGFLKYEKGKITAVYDIDNDKYVPITEFEQDALEKIGKLPEKLIPWKKVIKMKNKEEALAELFSEIENMNTLGAELALRYLRNSYKIAKKLVADGVAFKDEDVNTVLMTGFFHPYGPINNFITY